MAAPIWLRDSLQLFGLRILLLSEICINRASFEYLTSNDVLRKCQSACLILTTEYSNARIKNWLHVLQETAFSDKVGVEFGELFLDGFFWPNGNKLQLNDMENKDMHFLIFPKVKEDRTCLMKPEQTSLKIEPFIFNENLAEDTVLDFINIKCNLYQSLKGGLNYQGLHRQEILNNLFRVKTFEDSLTIKDVLHQIQGNISYSHFCLKGINKQGFEYCDNSFTNSQGQFRHKIYKSIPKCEQIETLSQGEFFHNYIKISKPVIIKGGVKYWQAMTKWTNEFLRKEYGENDVHIKLTPGGEYEGVEPANLWDDYSTFEIPSVVQEKLSFPDLVVVRPASLNMKFSEFLDIVEDVSSGKVKNVSAYLEYSSIPQYLPELELDIEELPFMKGILKREHLNIWLSDGNTLGKLHFDPFDNLLCQISGKKQVILFEPHNNFELYEGHIPEATLSYNKFSKQFHRRKRQDSTSMVMSPVDILNVDVEKFPLFLNARPLNCTLDEGDVLFMPSFWWHEVQSFPNVQAGRNLAVNYWYTPFLNKEFPCQHCSLDINPVYRHLL